MVVQQRISFLLGLVFLVFNYGSKVLLLKILRLKVESHHGIDGDLRRRDRARKVSFHKIEEKLWITFNSQNWRKSCFSLLGSVLSISSGLSAMQGSTVTAPGRPTTYYLRSTWLSKTDAPVSALRTLALPLPWFRCGCSKSHRSISFADRWSLLSSPLNLNGRHYLPSHCFSVSACRRRKEDYL